MLDVVTALLGECGALKEAPAFRCSATQPGDDLRQLTKTVEDVNEGPTAGEGRNEVSLVGRDSATCRVDRLMMVLEEAKREVKPIQYLYPAQRTVVHSVCLTRIRLTCVAGQVVRGGRPSSHTERRSPRCQRPVFPTPSGLEPQAGLRY